MLGKSLQRMLRVLGYDVRRVSDWPKADCPPPVDEEIAGPWMYHVLQMSNRSYSPPALCYRRGPFGDDHRLKYLLYFLDLRDWRVLEIGPLEGHHSLILEKLGVRETIAIESREDNLRKCNRIKQKYGLARTQYIMHDLEKLYTGVETPRFEGVFDLVFCLGVLYHVPEPAKALAWMRTRSSRLFLGTHYIDRIRTKPFVYRHEGVEYHGALHDEGGLRNPISGMSSKSFWPYEADLIRMIKDVGYKNVHVLGRDLQNGTPHITILAE